MFVGNYKDLPKIDMTPGGAKGAVKQVVIGPEQGWEDHVMRIMTLDVDGYSPTHTHDWPHINYVISGTGSVMISGQEYPVEQGTCAYVPSNEEHCFVNKGAVPLEFICIVPLRGEA
ncbi:MAG: cupin domain-containing protein [Peptococcaceae bacterium]|nr:cupin domain-containing protein [Peptococcaceae bacterium]